MKALILFGTRPEIIKLYPVITNLKKSERVIVHSGQHYDYLMSQKFLEDLKLPKVDYYLKVGSGSHAEQTSKIMLGLEQVIKKEKPDIVVVQGDTNTVLSGALTAIKAGVPCAHVEAGLRSYDWKMPEEINRIVADHISSALFAPTKDSAKNILNENIPKSKVFVTGNTIVDACLEYSKIAKKKSKIVKKLKLGDFALATIHRAENVDDPVNLKKIYSILSNFPVTIVFPIHPRTRKRLEDAGLLDELEKNKIIMLIDPVGYLDFLSLLMNCRFVITDSGGIQEESSILHVPCLTLRDNTERPESIKCGSNILTGIEPKIVLSYAKKLMEDKRLYNKMKKARNPFGDGRSGKRIVNLLRTHKFTLEHSNFLK
jgi:UDP-N-acetylglucosamine 2-epimerase (non-hydrolysing)